jgi:hypothetical protein
MANTWTTFRKARITCLSGANDSPFVFNDISKIKRNLILRKKNYLT